MSMNYVLAQSIGRGSYGSVYYAINRKTKQEVAIKVMNKITLKKQIFFNDSSDDEAQTGLSLVYDEIKFMKIFNHPLMLRLIETIDQDEKIYIVIELAEGIVATIHQRELTDDSLPDCINNLLQLQNEITPPQILINLAFHTAMGLLYMHKKQYVHGDIKPANILRTDDGRFILGDFGLSQSFAKGAKYKQIVSPAFSAPESQGLTSQNDVWSYGVVLFQLLFGEHPGVIAAKLWNGEKISHWGEVLIANQDKFKELLNAKRDEQIEKQKSETQQVSEYYELKLNSEIIHNIYGVLTEITYFCLIDVENRVCMESIYNRLLEFYCRIIAAKFAKYFQKGFFTQLHSVCQQLDMMNVDHVQFIVQLNSIRNKTSVRQEYQNIFEKFTTFKNIDFSFFKYLDSSPVSTKKTIQKQQSIVVQQISDVEGEISHQEMLNYVKNGSQQRQISSQSMRSTPKLLGKILDRNEEVTSPNSSSKYSSNSKLNLASQVSCMSNPPKQHDSDSDDTFFVETKNIKPTVSSNKLSNKPQFSQDSDSDDPQLTPNKTDVKPQFKKPVTQSLASQLANMPPPKSEQIESDSDEPLLAQNKPQVQPQVQFKKPVTQSLASKLANMPPPKNDQIDSDSDEIQLLNKAQPVQQKIQQPQPQKSLASSLANLPPPKTDIIDSDSDDCQLGKKMETKEVENNSDSEGNLGKPAESGSSIYGKFKKPQSLASSMAAKLAALPPPTSEDQEDSDGPMDIRAAKKKAGDSIKYEIDLNKLNEPEEVKQDIVSPLDKQQTQQSLEQLKDDVFGIEENQDNIPDSEDVKADLEQRKHFFLKLDLHLVDTDKLSSKQVKSLFKQISYTNDEYYKPFKYDHNNDQAKILGLGSFSNKDTLSVGRRESEDDDISDDDDDLVAFDDDGDDDFNNTFDQVFNIEEDEEDKNKDISVVQSHSLVNRGKGKFKTLRESEDEEEEQQMLPAFQINNVLIDEEDEDKLDSTEGFNSKNISNFGAGLLPFASNKKEESEDEELFQMKLQDSDNDESNSEQQDNKKLGFTFNLLQAVDQEKVRLFEDDSAEIFDTSSLLQNNEQINNKSSEQQIPLSARHLDVPKEETVDSIVLTPKQIVIFFHPLLQLFQEANQLLSQIKSPIISNSDYIFMIQQVQEIIDAYSKNISIVTVITVEIILDRLEMWKNQVQLILQNDLQDNNIDYQNCNDTQLKEPHLTHCFLLQTLLKQFQLIFSEIELIYDKNPSFLNTKTGWQAFNPYTLFQIFEQRFKLLNNSPHQKYSATLTINEQSMMAPQNNVRPHDIRFYVGLDSAECTPIVGLRHKVEEKTLVIQQSQRSFKLQDSLDVIDQHFVLSSPCHSKKEGLTTFQPSFMSFVFVERLLKSDFIQYSYSKSDLFKYSFINLQRQAMAPNFFINCLYELLYNSIQNCQPSVIRASLFNADGSFYMVVSDSGKGITQEQSESLFQGQFGVGTGLGYLRLLVGFYNGMINISSDDNSGTRVIIKIPMTDQQQQ